MVFFFCLTWAKKMNFIRGVRCRKTASPFNCILFIIEAGYHLFGAHEQLTYTRMYTHTHTPSHYIACTSTNCYE